MNVRIALALVGCLLAPRTAVAVELDFLERFALADDRAAVLQELVPGTEEFYYFQSLYLQQTGQFAEVDALLETWVERYGRSDRLQEIANRQALLRYPDDAEKTLEYMKTILNLEFNHQRHVPGEEPDLPSVLDPALISRETLLQKALENPQYENTIQGFQRGAYDWLLDVPLDPERLRDLLQALDLPDHEGLPALIAKDLDAPHGGGFSSIGIHRNLLRGQLDALLDLKPGLINEEAFVVTYVQRLRPSADAPNWRVDSEEREAYLARLEEFVASLSPAFNSLKAHVLYHRLQHDMRQGVYDRGRLLQYLAVPRQLDYVNPKFLTNLRGNVWFADLGHDFSSATGLEPIGGDEPLVREYLQHLFLAGETIEPFEPYIQRDYLRRLFAETKLLEGAGNMEQWYSWLDPATVETLTSRVDIEFAVENRQQYDPEEPVTLDVWVKNVDRLLVKVFEIEEANYYQQFNRRVNTDIALEGLVPNHEEVYTYSEPPLRRVKRSYAFPQLDRRGVWVIEFVGNGQSSRAVVEKGRLHFLSRTGPAGQMITVFDERGEKLPDASVWFSGRTYTANERGEIALPFSTAPGQKPVVLMHGDFATLDSVQHDPENYELAAGFHVDRESLRAGSDAQVAVRALLYLNGAHVPVGLLKDPALSVMSRTQDGITSSQEVRDFELHQDLLSVHTFQVPENLARLEFTLRGHIDNLTSDDPVALTASYALDVNGINKTHQTAASLLSKFGEDYVLELRDKTGLPVPGRAAYVTLHHKDFVEPVNVALKTDGDGRVVLGALDDIVTIRVSVERLMEQVWHLRRPHFPYPSALHGTTGEALHVPFSGEAEPNGSSVSLIEVRDGAYVADRSDALAVGSGYITVSGLAAGDYLLHIKPIDQRITIRLTEGEPSPLYVASDARVLQVTQPTPLQIQAVEADAEQVRIEIGAYHPAVRVHVVATRFTPESPAGEALNVARTLAPAAKPLAEGYALYQSGRAIGDEYRYILERRFATKFPGNMLERPSLLLNPWARQETHAEQEPAAPPGAPQASPPPAVAQEVMREAEGEPQQEPVPLVMSHIFDFLSGDSAAIYNLAPDEDGVVTIPRADLHGRQYLQIVATDPTVTVSHHMALPRADVPIRDLRLAEALDPQRHLVERQQIHALDGGESVTLNRAGEPRFQIYDSIAGLYMLFTALNNDPKLHEFSFITRWPELNPEQKLEKISKCTSHELNLFLYFKDRSFFDEVVRPFVENKYRKTFVDEWLLARDLTYYLDPWRYQQLNTAEKILLARRITEEASSTVRYIQELAELRPPDPQRFNMLFMTALYGGALGGGLQDVSVEWAFNGVSVPGNGAFDPRGGGQGGFGARGGVGGGFGGIAVGRPVLRDINGDGVGQDIRLHVEAAGRVVDRISAAPEAQEARAEVLEAMGYLDRQEAEQDRQDYRRLYKAPEVTREWVENYYYKLPIEQQTAGLVGPNAFWRDFAEHDPAQPFRSIHIAEAAGNFPEMMLALAVTDLPFHGADHDSEMSDAALALTAGSPLLVFYKDIQPAEGVDDQTPVLVSQNFFRLDDRYTFDGNERFDKFVRDEFLSGPVYGCQVTVTNPTSTPHEIDLLRQIPEGALPVSSGRYTKSERMRLEPYSTAVLEYYFYFPLPGQFDHYPVHVSEGGKLLAYAAPQPMNVVEVPTAVDTASWQYVSQQGSAEEVLDFLRDTNLHRINLEMIAWRMRDRAFYDRALDILEQRHIYQPVLWAYGVYHNDPNAIRMLLTFRDDVIQYVGPWIESPLLTIEPVERKAYQHIEYAPLINPRAHALKDKWRITNNQLQQQYARLMNILAHRPGLDQDDLMAVTYYMLLQDRVADALRYFERVAPEQLETRLQYDYIQAYFALYLEAPERAGEIAAQYAGYPVERWRTLFAEIRAHAAEAAGMGTDRDGQTQDRLAAREPRLELEIKDDRIVIHHENLSGCQVSIYPIDIEMLFTGSPFAPARSNIFSSVAPAATIALTFELGVVQTELPVPDRFANSQVVIEVEAAGISRSDIRYASRFVAQLIEAYGQVHVVDEDTRPLPKVYVKVFARMRNGETMFYKDGYTDLRGRFDYASSSTLDIAAVEEFAMLILSDDHGAKVMKAGPPVR